MEAVEMEGNGEVVEVGERERDDGEKREMRRQMRMGAEGKARRRS